MSKSHYQKENNMEQFTLEEIKEKILIEGLKKIMHYYTLFRYTSPINESTNETLSFEEWYKTVGVTRETSYLPRYITDNMGNIAIKELYKSCLREKYDEYFRKVEEEVEEDD